MKGQKSFRIEGYDKQIVVTELSVRQIMNLFQFQDLENIESWSSISQYVQEKILPATTNLSLDELLDFTPTELKQVWDKVKEVNSTFFGLTRAPIIKKVLEEAVPRLRDAFGDSVADLSKLVTLTRENMDTLTSLMQSMKEKDKKKTNSNE